MLILVSVSAVLTTVGQAWSKTAFAITLLRPGITEGWKRWVLWFIIASLNIFCGITMFLQFTNYCGETPYSWKIQGGCANYDTIFAIKMGRNSECNGVYPKVGVRARLTRQCSVQYHHGLRLGTLSMVGDMEIEDQADREDRYMRDHEPWCGRCHRLYLAYGLHDEI